MQYKQFIRTSSLASVFVEPEGGWESLAKGEVNQIDLKSSVDYANEFSIIFINDENYGNYIWNGGYVYNANNSHGDTAGHIYNEECDSLAEGVNENIATLNVASGVRSHAEGVNTEASGEYSHAEGEKTLASEQASHAEGYETSAEYKGAHAEGGYTKASGKYSHAEGSQTTASGDYSHAEGGYTKASGKYSHAEGYNTNATGYYSHAGGKNTTASGYASCAEGVNTEASGEYSHAEGFDTEASGEYSHAEGQYTTASGYASHAEGKDTEASGEYSHTEGGQTKASEKYSHAEGSYTTASGWASHAEGYNTNATQSQSHAEGESTTAAGWHSHAEGNTTTASGWASHAEGYNTNATQSQSHAEGAYTTASGESSHAEGYESETINSYAHAEGYYTSASGQSSHAEGNTTTALGEASHAEGTGGNVTLFQVLWVPEYGNTILYYNNQNSGGSASDSAFDFFAGSDFQSDAFIGNSASDITEKYRIEKTNKSAGWIGRTLYLADGSVLGVITRFPDEIGGQFEIDRAAQIPSDTWVSAYIKTGAAGESSHSEGYLSDAAGKYSHAEGERTRVTGTAAHGEGIKTQAYGAYSHAEGEQTQSLAFGSHSEGKYTHAEGEYTHVEGYDTKASGLYAHSEGIHSSAQGEGSHAEGYNTRTDGNTTYKETKHKVILDSISDQTIVLRYVGNDQGKFEDYFNSLRTIQLKNQNDRTEKIYLINCVVDSTSDEYIYLKINSDIKQGASAIDYDRGYTIGATYDVLKEVTTVAAHAEGKDTQAAQTASHSEGINTKADGDAAHAEGIDSKVLSNYAHAEGVNTFINEHSEGSHTEGYESQINSNYSHAEGWKSFVQSKEEFVNRNAKVKILSYDSTTHHIVLELAEGDFDSLCRTFDERRQSSVQLKPIANAAVRIKLHNFIDYSADYSNVTIELAPRYDSWGASEKEEQSGIKGDVSYNISDYPDAIFQVSRNEYFGFGAHAEGGETLTEGTYAHAEGEHTKALEQSAHAEGYYAEAAAEYSHAEGFETETQSAYSHAEGYKSITKIINKTITSPVEFIGYMHTPVNPDFDPYEFDREDLEFFEGSSRECSFQYALQIENTEESSADPISNIPNLIGSLLYKDDEGQEYLGKIVNAARCRTNHYDERIYFSLDTSQLYDVSSVWRRTVTYISSGVGAHAEGSETYTEGTYAHAEGEQTKAIGQSSHAEGYNTETSGDYAHAEGVKTKTKNYAEHAQGFRNVSHKASDEYGNKGNTLFSVGAGGNYIGEPEFIGYFKGTVDWSEQVNWQYYSGSDTTVPLEYCLITERHEMPTPAIADIENLVGSQLFSDDEKKQYLGTVIAAARYDQSDPDKASARIYLALDNYVHVYIEGNWAISCWRVEKETYSNALEITQNGDIYIRGAGNFNGDNINEAQTLQQLLKNTDPSDLSPLFETISAALNNLNEKLIALDTVVSATLVNHENRLQNLETTYEIPEP